MTAWTVTLRGIRYRWGRSLAVLLLATVAVTAAVLAPAYSRAAQQSVLLDGLTHASLTSTGLLVGAATPADAAAAPTSGTRLAISNALGRYPTLKAAFGTPVASVEAESQFGDPSDALAARLAYRDGACEHLVVTGACPTAEGQVLVSDRSAKDNKLATGQQVTLRGKPGRTRTLIITGTYTPVDASAGYWGRTAYFNAGSPGPDGASTRTDALFVGIEEDVRSLGTDARVRFEYPLKPQALDLDNVASAREDLKLLGRALPSAGGLQVTSALPGVLDDIVVEQEAVARNVPVVAIPLVLLSLFVLFLLVAAVTEERSPELALAKLRGYPLARAGRFGFAESLVLIVLAAPLGLVAGLLLVRAAAAMVLAPGTAVELSGPVLLTTVAAVAGAVLAALGAGWRTLGRPVLALLRRVPNRAKWRATVLEVAAATLAAVALFQAFRDRSSALALVAAPLLALVAGMAVARLLTGYARGSLRRAGRRGRLAALLSAAQLARRPAGHRIVVVLTVAVALLTFAATSWDVAAGARTERARQTMGADRVFTVDVAHPDALVAAVAQADPSGQSMAVVRGQQHYGDGSVELLAVESAKLPAVADWAGHDLKALAGKLRPGAVAPVVVKDRIEVDASAANLKTEKDRPLRLVAVVSAPGEPPRTVGLGVIVAGGHTYGAPLPGCATGCRLLGLGVSRTPGSTDVYTVDVTLSAVRGADGPVDAGFEADGRWRRLAARAPQAELTVRSGPGLGLGIRSGDAGDVIAEHVSAPDTIPVVAVGAVPKGDAFAFPALTDRPQQFGVAARADRLPRAGDRGLLFDLDYAVRSAERTTSLADTDTLRYEVWASPKAPADLGKRLTAAGARVLESDSVDGTVTRLERLAPALSLRLYLLAGAAAVLLAVGAVLLTAYVGATARLNELAALRLAGVPASTLRRGVLREYRALLGVPLLVGAVTGIGGAALMLPGLQLVSVRDAAGLGDLADAFGPGWLPAALLAVVCGLGLAVAVVLRMFAGASPHRLREGER
ncbi:hypothetical protein Lfu02_52070 [Longispora fulva]|uniref:FtsX-like permease family protein n=1 Tax=Longispora fulva TaxID=619741 RepID=A0A8J7KMU3_9ACTN|nr:hypothetical protein [Longispora fulva]MBG6140899.1 hypothetical protein [Longispora fulva]GIG60835.1 hypothetical protein Lfu02_52070 [Longispora fulva]